MKLSITISLLEIFGEILDDGWKTRNLFSVFILSLYLIGTSILLDLLLSRFFVLDDLYVTSLLAAPIAVALSFIFIRIFK